MIPERIDGTFTDHFTLTCIHVFSRVTRCVTMATVMDKSSFGGLHVQGGQVNEAVVYEVSHYGDHAPTMVVGGCGFHRNV